jgi:hypothetical protein
MNAVEIMARLRELYTKFPTLPCGDCHACCLDIRYVYISMLEHDMCPGFAWPQQAIRNEMASVPIVRIGHLYAMSMAPMPTIHVSREWPHRSSFQRRISHQ